MPHRRNLKTVLLSCLLVATIVLIVSFQREESARSSSILYVSNPGVLTGEDLFPSVVEYQLRSGTKKFDNEEARPIGFRTKNLTRSPLSTKFISLATPFFGEWNPKHYYFLSTGDASFRRYSCPISACHVTKNRSLIGQADALLFHMRDLESYSFPPSRHPRQIWILYSMEPPWLEIKNLRRFDGLFNWTMSYRAGSDLLVKYGFVGKKPKSTPIEVPKMYSKLNKAVWYVSNCCTDSRRENYVRRLRNIYPVDILGGCGVESCRPAETEKCYSKVAKRYKFYLAFENAICDSYVTEKLFNALSYPIVPVVFGGVDYSLHVPRGAVINALDFNSPEDLGRFLWKVSTNDTLYLSYFEWKRQYRAYLQPWMCELCARLHSPVGVKIHHDLERWWTDNGSCKMWTDKELVPSDESAFPCYKKKLI